MIPDGLAREIDEERIIAKLTYYMRVVLSKEKNRRKGGWGDLMPLTCVTRARHESYEAVEIVASMRFAKNWPTLLRFWLWLWITSSNKRATNERPRAR